MSDNMERAMFLRGRTRAECAEPQTFACAGREWDLLPGVFSPSLTPVTEVFTEWLEYPVGGSFLEMGCGAGVTAVTAALAGCTDVLAVDISAAAVRTTRRNAERHGVEDVVRTRESDVFAAVDPEERFDLIFWNSNFVLPPADFTTHDDLDLAFVDPGYAAHERYVTQGLAHLTSGGRLLLGFSALGEMSLLESFAAAAGARLLVLGEQERRLEIPMRWQLLEIVADEKGPR